MKVEIQKYTYCDDIKVVVTIDPLESVMEGGIVHNVVFAKKMGTWKCSEILGYFSNVAKKLEEKSEQTRESPKS